MTRLFQIFKGICAKKLKVGMLEIEDLSICPLTIVLAFLAYLNYFR
jgi:hypothetical protein